MSNTGQQEAMSHHGPLKAGFLFLMLGGLCLMSIPAVAKGKASTQRESVHSAQSTVDISPYFATPDGETAMDAFRGRRYEEAAELFHILAREPIPPEVEQPAKYMEAVSTHYSGDFKKALALFLALEKSYPLLKRYHQFFQAEALSKLNKKAEALLTYQKIPTDDANGERATRKALNVARSLDQHGEVLRLLEAYGNHYSMSSELLSIKADTYTALGKTREAADVWRLIQVKWPESSAEAKAKEGIKALKLSKKRQRTWGALQPNERWKRAEKLFKTHKSEVAASVYATLAKTEKKGTNKRCKALHFVARSYDKLRKRKDSAPWHAKAVKECKKDKLYPQILYFSGKSAFQLGQHDRALREFDSLHTLFPAVSFNDDAWIWEAHIHKSENRPKKRKKALNDALEKMPQGDMREQAEWLLMWDQYQEKDWEGVIKTANRSLAKHPNAQHRYAEGRRIYWKARALEKLRRTGEANALYSALQELYPLSFYAVMGYQRLEKNAGKEGAKAILKMVETKGRLLPQALPGTPSISNPTPALQRAFELIRIGLPSPALRELDRSKYGTTPEETWLLSELLYRAGLHHRSYQVTRARRGDYKNHFPVGPATRLWKLAYPEVHMPLMTKGAKDAEIPEEFGLAIMRTESAFKADAESWANAIGLMQLLVPTAQGLATSEEKRPTAASLKIPSVNIRLGTRFLGQLVSRFKHIPMSAAGYNAGQGALGRWVKARGHLPFDEFVERIPFREARRYVKSVTSAMAVYHYLNRGEMMPVPIRIPK